MALGVKVLVLNVGSSTLKCWFQDIPGGAIWTAKKEWKSSEDGAALMRGMLESIGLPREIDIIGHRIVHGGAKYRESVFITPEVRAGIASQAEFAPAHNRIQLAAIEAIGRIVGERIPQVTVFDTAFHRTLAPPAYVYPGPFAWLAKGIRRYGFHGISVQYATRRAAELLEAPVDATRLIVCHLGNGASVTAVAQGKSVDTSMGFTPLEGIMMGTRSGSIDPSIATYLLRHGTSADDLDAILNKQSGLLGVSGVSGDMREILEAIDKGNERAKLAYDIYAHRLSREIGAMLAVLGGPVPGVDAIVFTGGIGENCAPLRRDVCAKLEFLGLKLDEAKNARPQLDENIAATGSRVQVLVIRAEEDLEIARECLRLRSAAPSHA
ncbi:MAG TPA: acetate/propionate family kinase [Bryobacteraceae bacterium]|nr:acetate/propionate family kinase [Bryobacteraceae bacterium]